MVKQLEIIHMLGFTHGDLKLQNICYSESNKSFTIIDFALATNIVDNHGNHLK